MKSLTQCSDKEFKKRWIRMVEISKEAKDLQKCPTCKKKFVKVDKYTWKMSCKCHNPNLRISIG